MLTSVSVQNVFSIQTANVTLQPFTLLLGANNSGKSNFLKLFQWNSAQPHFNHKDQDSLLVFENHHDHSSF